MVSLDLAVPGWAPQISKMELCFSWLTLCVQAPMLARLNLVQLLPLAPCAACNAALRCNLISRWSIAENSLSHMHSYDACFICRAAFVTGSCTISGNANVCVPCSMCCPTDVLFVCVALCRQQDD